MFFNSLEYAIFLGIVLVLNQRLSHRWQNRMLLVASYVFYGCWDYRFLSLILVSTIVDFCAAPRIAAARARGDAETSARAWLVLSLATNLGILGFFKYWNFFVDSAARLLPGFSTAGQVPWTLSIILPVGISFYTFQTMSYTIDVYRGRMRPIASLPDFALYVAFFPQLVAGPIERASRLLPQVQSPRRLTPDAWRQGWYLILVGLVRKVIVADTAGALADGIFEHAAACTSLQLACGLLLYSLQIYGDFAGYSNIARGSARLLGFDLMRNFSHPYFSASPAEFWRRWHISLSTWLRDYLYIPLGGSRCGTGRTTLNLMTTMLLGGLWHGASWNFVAWGGLHGLLLAGQRLLRRPAPEDAEAFSPRRVAGMCLTFPLVALLWLPFRSQDMATTLTYLRGLGALTMGGVKDLVPLGLLAGIVLLIDFPQFLAGDEFAHLRLPSWQRGVLAGLAISAMLLCGRVDEPFIYFQF